MTQSRLPRGELSRRDFVRLAAGTAGAALLPARAGAAGALPARLADIEHIVILMKENRSFDHYFGTLAGVRGFDDAGGARAFAQPDPAHPEGRVLPFRLDTVTTSAQRLHDLSHSWSALHASWHGGAMDRFIAAHRKTDGDAAPLAMGYHTRADLPLYYALADAFTVCDGYHCSVLGPTHPNRIMLMTGTIDAAGARGQPATNNSGRAYTWETYPERLQRAGVSWRVYHEKNDFGCNVLKYFTQFQGPDVPPELAENALRNRPLATLLEDLRTGNIPQVTWIVPPSTVTEHPDYLPAAGEDHTRRVLEALWSNRELWAHTVFILNYDENDGLFDHVAPPVPEPGTPDEYVGRSPVGLGMRVPCLVISPWSRGRYVCGTTFDHTSTLRLIEARFGVEVAHLSAWRRSVTGDLTTALRLGHAPDLSVPRLPDTAARLVEAQYAIETLAPPQVPAVQALPHQEAGQRLRLA